MEKAKGRCIGGLELVGEGPTERAGSIEGSCIREIEPGEARDPWKELEELKAAAQEEQNLER